MESLWPSPGVELRFPNREVRVTFNVVVDSRTFTGQVVDESGQIANGIDGAPALFTRSEETTASTREVIGTIAALKPGKYTFTWSVKSTKGESLSFDVPFTQFEPVSAPGGSNHRHDDLKLPGEEGLMVFSRALLAFGFAFGFAFAATRRWTRYAAAGVISTAGVLYTTAFALPAYDSDLTMAELLARIDGWAAVGVLVAAAAAALARNRQELLVIVTAAAVSAQATTYVPRLSYGLVHLILLVAPLAAIGAILAGTVNTIRASTWKPLLFSVTAALSPVLSIILTAGTLNPDRGQGQDLRTRLIAAAVIMIATTLSLLIAQLTTTKWSGRIRLAVLLAAVVAAAVATGAPALL